MDRRVKISQEDTWEVRDVRIPDGLELTENDLYRAFNNMPMVYSGYLARAAGGKWYYFTYPSDVPLSEWNETWEVILYVIHRGSCHNKLEVVSQ